MGLRLPTEIGAWVRQRAREQERSLSAIISRAIRVAMELEAQADEGEPVKKPAKTKAAKD
jgi:hypothetical protein